MRKLDKVLLLVWWLIFAVVSLFGIFIEGTSIFFIKIFFKGKSRRKAMNLLSNISSIMEKSYFSFKAGIEKTILFRRIMSLLLFIFIFFYFCPPYTFGKWRLYEKGIASYYSWGFYCRAAASGEIYWPWKYAAAHKSLPLGSVVKVVNLDNGRVIYVRIFDRGPFVKGRIIDLTRSAAHDLGIVENGIAPVEIYVKD